MPIKPKPSGLEVLGAFVTGDRGVENRRYREQTDRFAQRDALAEEDAARERERHQLEIERVKRKRAEEETDRLRQEQERAASREATRWGIERVQKEIAAQQGGGAKVDPETAALLNAAGPIADKLSEAGRKVYLEEVKGVAETARLSKAKDLAADKIGNFLKDLGTSETDVSPVIQELQGAMEQVSLAETPEQVAEALQTANTAVVKLRQAVVKDHVEADTRKAAIAEIQNLYAGDPAKAKQVSFLSRMVQFGGMAAKEAVEIAVKDRYGLKPKTAQEYAAEGGDLDAIWKTPQGRMAASWMLSEGRNRALKRLPLMVGPEVTTEQREEVLARLLEHELALVRAENGWYSSGQNAPQAIQPQAAIGPAAEPSPEQPSLYPLSKRPGDSASARPPKVPLEQVREAMGGGEGATIDSSKRFRPLKNADGTTSTIRTMSFEEDGREVLIPTVVEGKQLSEKAAIEHYRKTGEHFGKFASVEEANAEAERLHKAEEAKGQDDPEATRQAVAAELVKKGKAEGWSKEKYQAELRKALKDMDLLP